MKLKKDIQTFLNKHKNLATYHWDKIRQLTIYDVHNLVYLHYYSVLVVDKSVTTMAHDAHN